MKHVFIVNPAAGKKDYTGEVSRHIQEICREMGLEFAIYKTSRPGHATELVQQIAGAEPEKHFRFYACGGDGTLNEVVNGISKVDNAAFTNYPMGTGNDFIRYFGADAEKFRDIRALIEGEEHPIDYIESTELDSVNIVSAGIDARIADGKSRYRMIGSGMAPYLCSTLEHVIRGIGEPLEVRVDGVNYDGDYTMICLTNGLYYGGGFNPAPEARIADGELELLLVKKITRARVPGVILKYKEGRYKELPDLITCLHPKEVRIRALDGGMTVNFDGETRVVPEITFRLSDRRIPLILPKGVRP